MAARDFPFHVVKDPGRITASPTGLAFAPELDGDGLFSNDLSFASPLRQPWRGCTLGELGVR